LPIAFADLGAQQVKNIQEPIRAYEVAVSGKGLQPVSAENGLPALPDRPSLAVLPFENMSGDAEQEYFADGIVEDIITALSRFKSLMVIARNSSFTYKGKAVDIKQVGRELGVRYVLEGSVRKSGDRVRITAQLIDSMTGAHIWAERHEGKPQDVFDLQDQVTASVVGQLAAHVELAETERVKRKPPASLDAYDCCLRGRAGIWKWSKAGAEEAQAYFFKAIELDENYAIAHAFAGQMYVVRKQNRWMADVEKESAEAIRLARRAIELGPQDDLVLCISGFILAYIGGELDLAAECIGRGLSINPNLAFGWNFSGWVHVYLGEHEKALEHARRAERLSPREPNILQVKVSMGFARFFNGQYNDAGRLAERIVEEYPTFVPAWRVLAVSQAFDGDPAGAVHARNKAMEIDPSQTVSSLAVQMPLRRLEDRKRWEEGLRQAGFPP
jgi:TolB-like protein